MTNVSLETLKTGPTESSCEPHGQFTLFLPARAWAGCQAAVEALVSDVGATGYTMLPIALGGWLQRGTWTYDELIPLQILAPNTAKTLAVMSRFGYSLAGALSEEWLFMYQIAPVYIADQEGTWST